GEHLGIAADAGGVEERSVRHLRRMGEGAGEAMDEDRGPAVDDGERISPQAECEPEAEVCGEKRVWTLAREIRSRSRYADDERIERLVELCASELDRAEKRLRVGDRRRAGERGRNAQLDVERAQDLVSRRVGKRTEHV